MRAKLILACGLVALCSASRSQAQPPKSFCFAMAESYYEQLYCEIQAKGEGKNLPAFYQFKNNTEQTQALLLKRPASRIGITVKPPTLKAAYREQQLATRPKKTTQPDAKPPLTEPRAPRSQSAALPSTPEAIPTDAVNCVLNADVIRCNAQRFQLQTNRHNRHLTSEALGSLNQLLLPRYTGDMTDETAVRRYLYAAYERYISQMRSIGLGGVTTRFGKFSYLFYDYHAKNIDFVDRFETLFNYLKKDKAHLAVSEKAASTQGMLFNQCAWLSEHYYICEHGNNNLVYAAP